MPTELLLITVGTPDPSLIPDSHLRRLWDEHEHIFRKLMDDLRNDPVQNAEFDNFCRECYGTTAEEVLSRY